MSIGQVEMQGERETVVRATGGRRMRRRPAAGASSSSRAAAVEGSCLFCFVLLLVLSLVCVSFGIYF